jgi:hypothetical protein
MPGSGRPFLPGNNANPHGRPKGSRHKLSESFLAAFYADFEKFGPKAIEDTRNKNPAEYVRAAVALLPKQVEDLTPNPFGELTEEELEQLGRLIEIMQNEQQLARLEAVLSLAPEQAVRLDAFLATLVAPSL